MISDISFGVVVIISLSRTLHFSARTLMAILFWYATHPWVLIGSFTDSNYLYLLTPIVENEVPKANYTTRSLRSGMQSAEQKHM